MSNQTADLMKISITGAASHALCTEFLRLISEHPKGEDHVTEKVGLHIVGLMMLVKEANLALREMPVPDAMAMVFDRISGFAWVMTYAPTISGNILLGALETSELPNDIKNHLFEVAKRRKAESATAYIWVIFAAYFSVMIDHGVLFAKALMQEYLVHLEELTA